MTIIIGLIGGLVFGLGLVISGMIDPNRVQGFLDLTGEWNPTLATVMGGGVIVTTIGYKLLFKRSMPLFAPKFYVPTKTDMDSKLILGSAIFGIGWGLGGLCPGPALTVLTQAGSNAIIFVIAMIAAMLAAAAINNKGA
ncbi:MAG: YeeE/YedE family protein [Gammaproteobacteria bacterium]|nr:YeeE/YedE family protein [Gammaproteobacteria bacterium]